MTGRLINRSSKTKIIPTVFAVSGIRLWVEPDRLDFTTAFHPIFSAPAEFRRRASTVHVLLGRSDPCGLP